MDSSLEKKILLQADEDSESIRYRVSTILTGRLGRRAPAVEAQSAVITSYETKSESASVELRFGVYSAQTSTGDPEYQISADITYQDVWYRCYPKSQSVATIIDDMVQDILDNFIVVDSSTRHNKRSRVVAAFNEGEYEGFEDTVEDLSETASDLQEAVDDVEEDDSAIEIENNIENHYIAECDVCQGVFISAVEHTDQEITSTNGVCPICGKESEQYLKWFVTAV